MTAFLLDFLVLEPAEDGMSLTTTAAPRLLPFPELLVPFGTHPLSSSHSMPSWALSQSLAFRFCLYSSRDAA